MLELFFSLRGGEGVGRGGEGRGWQGRGRWLDITLEQLLMVAWLPSCRAGTVKLSKTTNHLVLR